MDPFYLIGGLILGLVSYLIVYYLENFDNGFTSYQLFDRYNYTNIGYWCIIILSLFYLGKRIYMYSCYPSDKAFDKIICIALIELGAIIAAVRRLRE